MSTPRLSSRVKKEPRHFDPSADTDVEMKASAAVAAAGTSTSKVTQKCAGKKINLGLNSMALVAAGPSTKASTFRTATKSSSSVIKKKVWKAAVSRVSRYDT